MENVEGKDVGDQQHRTGGVRQLMDQFFSLAAPSHICIADIDVMNLARFRVLDQLLQVTRPVVRNAARFRVVVNAHHFKP
ncbi:Uncharacterised protein [Escherichia coli]|nr:Uncharacterised protein [Escherichia coli]